MSTTLLQGDCLDLLPTLDAGSVDALVTDPPAGIAFMGAEWDRDKGGRTAWIAWMTSVMQECHRVLKPGAHGLVWALPRTSHWTATALEDAGFEVRDVITHHFGTGFPKSLDISKALDKRAGAERDAIAQGKGRTGAAARPNGGSVLSDDAYEWPGTYDITAPATDLAAQWDGWGTALKPASEHWILVRKPLAAPNVAANVAQWGTGGLNIAGSRVGTELLSYRSRGAKGLVDQHFGQGDRPYAAGLPTRQEPSTVTEGRWPPNLLLSHASACNGVCVEDCPVAELDAQSGDRAAGGKVLGTEPSHTGESGIYHEYGRIENRPYSDTGGASRFFPTFRYAPKASRRERDQGCEASERNSHPTVKSQALMSWLLTLITPPGGTVLDPFAGSGSTGVAAVAGGWDFIGLERDPGYCNVAAARITAAQAPLLEAIA